MSTYAIGDIQGCDRQLQQLLAKIGFRPGRDRLWCVGDLVNRGPKSLDTLRRLREIDDSLVAVLGNHDLHFLAVHEGCAPLRRKDRLRELLAAGDCAALADWLRLKPLAHCEMIETETGPRPFLMVHAGFAPDWPVAKTLALAGEVEAALREKPRKYLSRMYGDEPNLWHDGLRKQRRLRTITNYLTRIRFCDGEGRLRLDLKEGIDTAPPGYAPWFCRQRVSAETDIVFGHWAALKGASGRKGVHALDTGCVWGGILTAMRLEDGRRFSVPGWRL